MTEPSQLRLREYSIVIVFDSKPHKAVAVLSSGGINSVRGTNKMTSYLATTFLTTDQVTVGGLTLPLLTTGPPVR